MQIHIYFSQSNHLSKSIRKITYKNVKGKYKIILNNLYMLMLVFTTFSTTLPVLGIIVSR